MPIRDKHSHSIRAALLVALGSITLIGCGEAIPVESLRRQGTDALSSEATFRSAADLLDGLDQTNDIQLDRSTVLIDATQSADKQPVLAIVTRPTGVENGPVNQLHVPAKNVDFRKRGIVEGDAVDLIVPEIRDESIPAAGIGRNKTIRLRIASVVDPQTLLLGPDALNQELLEPQPIIITRSNNEKLDRSLARIRHWRETGQPPIGWEPTPDEDALDELVQRFNNWLQGASFAPTWSADPIAGDEKLGLSADVRKNLGDLHFAREEGRLLQEALWLRDVARRAAGQAEPLEQATQLFDWIVRNVQLEKTDWLAGWRQRPWQALALGRATAEERAWIFVLLLRQIKIESVILAIPAKEPTAPPRVWTVAALVDGKAHLFDPALGLPLVGPEGQGVATLEQIRATPALLSQQDVDASQRYGVSANDVSKAIALVEVTPLYLTRRAQLVEAQLAGEQRIVLSSQPSRTVELAKKHVADVRLWDIAATTDAAQRALPAATRGEIARQFNAFALVPLLWKGRVVQLKGNPFRWELDALDRRVRIYAQNQDPKFFFLAEQCSPSAEQLAEVEQARPHVYDAYRISQMNARYWLGLTCFESGDYPAAIVHFAERTLQFLPSGAWAKGARYNVARTHERLAEALTEAAKKATGDAPIELPAALVDEFASRSTATAKELNDHAADHRKQAIELYQKTPADAPQRPGDLLRAIRLERRSAEAPAKTPR